MADNNTDMQPPAHYMPQGGKAEEAELPCDVSWHRPARTGKPLPQQTTTATQAKQTRDVPWRRQQPGCWRRHCQQLGRALALRQRAAWPSPPAHGWHTHAAAHCEPSTCPCTQIFSQCTVYAPESSVNALCARADLQSVHCVQTPKCSASALRACLNLQSMHSHICSPYAACTRKSSVTALCTLQILQSVHTHILN